MLGSGLLQRSIYGMVGAGLAENRCLERRQQGAQLLQIGEQEIAFGAKFRARVVLDIQVRFSGSCLFRADAGAYHSQTSSVKFSPHVCNKC